MYGFSRILLEHAVRLAGETIPPDRDARVTECIDDIRQYLSWMADEELASDYYPRLRESVAELSGIALRHREQFRDVFVFKPVVIHEALPPHEQRTTIGTPTWPLLM